MIRAGLHRRAGRALAGVAALFAACGAQAASPALASGVAARPNILLVISDDIGLDASTGLYPGLVEDAARRYGPQGRNHPGAAAIRGRPASTPTLDAFARQGMTFGSAWAEPFCSPTRASILTGLFAAKANVLNYADPLSQQHVSFVRSLKDEAGYATGLFGKWHLAGLPGKDVSYPGMKPKEAGFQVFKGNLHAAIRTYWDYDYMEQDAATPADRWRTGAAPVRSLPGIAPTTMSGVVQVADALEWITAQEAADPRRPWFAWVAFNLAHATSQLKPSQMMVPEADTLDAPSRSEMQACGGTFGTHEVGRCSGEALLRAMTNSMDTLIGRLLSGVEALDANTVVIYIGDNGTPMYGRPNLDFIDNLYISRKGRGKGTVYESGVRVPFAVRGPGIAPGRTSGEYVHAADVFPTVLELAGLRAPAHVPSADRGAPTAVDGRSLVPLLRGQRAAVRDPDTGYLLTESLNLMTDSTRQVAARNATYKVVCTEKVDNDACEFFNLRDDPLEEYALPEPADCAAPRSPGDAAWHYCRLAARIREDSFFARGR